MSSGTNDKHLFENRFEIPLTVMNTEEVFDNIKETPSESEFLDSKLIKTVYLPVHTEDGTSGRPFWYDYPREAYYDLIRKILVHKPVVVTCPGGDPDIIEKYIDLGVREFMVSQWDERYEDLKKKYGDLKLDRSIVKNAYNDTVDERFDTVIIPYKRLLDLKWIQEASEKVSLVAIINQYCRVRCQNLDNHLKKELQNTANEELKEFSCPKGRSFFIPRQAVLRMLPYVDTFKIVDRLLFPFDYEKYIKYYTGEEMLNEGHMGTDLISLTNFYDCMIIHKLYPHSKLVDMDCRFECDSCRKKCY